MTSVTFAGRKQEESPNPLFTRCLRHLHHDVFSLFAAGSSPPMWWAKVGQTFKFFVIKIDLSRVLFWLKVLKNSWTTEGRKKNSNKTVIAKSTFGSSKWGIPSDDDGSERLVLENLLMTVLNRTIAHERRKKGREIRIFSSILHRMSHGWKSNVLAPWLLFSGGEKAHKEKTPKVRKKLKRTSSSFLRVKASSVVLWGSI